MLCNTIAQTTTAYAAYCQNRNNLRIKQRQLGFVYDSHLTSLVSNSQAFDLHISKDLQSQETGVLCSGGDTMLSSTHSKAAATVTIDVYTAIGIVTISCSGFMDRIPCMGKTFSQGYQAAQIRLPIQIPESVEKGIVLAWHPMSNVSPRHLCYSYQSATEPSHTKNDIHIPYLMHP